MKVCGYIGLVSLIFISTSCVGNSANGIASLPPYDGASRSTSFKAVQAQELLGVLDKIVEGEKKHIGLLGEWHLRGLRFDCIVDEKPSSGWFMVTDAEKGEVELSMSPMDDALSENGIVLSGLSLAIANHIYGICEKIDCNASEIKNIRVHWRAGHEGTFYKGTVYLNNDGSVRDRSYGSL